MNLCSLNLILVTHDDGASDSHLEHLLDYVFQAMVLLYGIDNISNIKNLERFKREIKVRSNSTTETRVRNLKFTPLKP